MEKLNEKQKELLEHCRYYKGEKGCPFKDDDVRSLFWFGEKQFVKNPSDAGQWIEQGRKVRAGLVGDKLKHADKYTELEFGIIVFIEMLFSSHDPYDDMRWIYDY